MDKQVTFNQWMTDNDLSINGIAVALGVSRQHLYAIRNKLPAGRKLAWRLYEFSGYEISLMSLLYPNKD
jgi:predicted DNA-binding protein YlxM (UPF0122 family)